MVTLRRRTLPLGVDVGRKRVRIALVERRSADSARLLAVAARDYAGDPRSALASAYAELQTRERRCILALTRPDAVLGTVEFPPMTAAERQHAARFEAARFVDYPIAQATVNVVPADVDRRWVVGVVRRNALAALLASAKSSGLRPVAVDDAAFALRRAQPGADGIVDVGERATRLILYGTTVPLVAEIGIGGAQLTEAIADALGIDRETAEERKRTIGFAGAGSTVLEDLIARISAGINDARRAGAATASALVVCGNGGRVAGFSDALGGASGCTVRPATIPAAVSDALPADVLRAAAADWSLAYGLALWTPPA
jgi:Tfp pilus assembly PilM family ATPase